MFGSRGSEQYNDIEDDSRSPRFVERRCDEDFGRRGELRGELRKLAAIRSVLIDSASSCGFIKKLGNWTLVAPPACVSLASAFRAVERSSRVFLLREKNHIKLNHCIHN